MRISYTSRYIIGTLWSDHGSEYVILIVCIILHWVTFTPRHFKNNMAPDEIKAVEMYSLPRLILSELHGNQVCMVGYWGKLYFMIFNCLQARNNAVIVITDTECYAIALCLSENLSSNPYP